MVIVRVGQSSAFAAPVKANAATATNPLTTFLMVSSLGFLFWSSDERDRFGHLEDAPDFG
jgi:hypothetical protein